MLATGANRRLKARALPVPVAVHQLSKAVSGATTITQMTGVATARNFIRFSIDRAVFEKRAG